MIKNTLRLNAEDHQRVNRCINNYDNRFMANVIRSLREGESDYIFSLAQLEEVKALLKANERERLMIINNDDGYIKIKLRKAKRNARKN